MFFSTSTIEQSGFLNSHICPYLLASHTLCVLSFFLLLSRSSWADNGRAGKQSLLSHTVSLLPISVVVNMPDVFFLHLQSPSCFALPTMRFLRHSALCINICLHQWSYCSEGGSERKEEFAPIGACAIVFPSWKTWGTVAHLPLGSTHPALNVLLLFHHASFCATSLLLCHRLLLVLSCFFFSFFDPRRRCSLLPSSSFFTFPLSAPVCQPMTLLYLSPVWYSVYSRFSPLPSYLPHEDSAPAEADELPQSERAGQEREKFTRGQRGEAEEGRSQCHLEQVLQKLPTRTIWSDDSARWTVM